MNYYVSTIAVMTKNRIIDWYGNANEYADIDVFENQYACIELVNPRYKKRHVQMMMNLNGSPMPTDEMASDFVSYSVLPEISERNPKLF